MSIFSILCWATAFGNMLFVFLNLELERYVPAAFNFLVAFMLIRQRVTQDKQETECEME